MHACRSKALSMAQLLNQTLGSPLLVQEDEVKEFTGADNTDQYNNGKISVQQRIDNSTVTVFVKITAAFECSERTKRGGN